MPDTITVTDERGRKATISYVGAPPSDDDIAAAFETKYPSKAVTPKSAARPATVRSRPADPFHTATPAPTVPTGASAGMQTDTPGQAELRRIYPQIRAKNPNADLNIMLSSVKTMTPEQVRAGMDARPSTNRSTIRQGAGPSPIDNAVRFAGDAIKSATDIPAAVIEARLLKRQEVAAGIIRKAANRTTAAGAFGRSAGRATLPTAAGFAGATAAAPAGAALGGLAMAPTGNPLLVAGGEIVGGIGGGLAGAVLGGHVVNKFQDDALGWLLGPETKVLLDAAFASDREEQPVAQFAGELAPSLGFGLPNLERGAAATMQRVAGAGVGAGMEGYSQVQERRFNPFRLAAATGAGALLSGKETQVGKVITAPTRAAGEAVAGAIRKNATAPILAGKVLPEVDAGIVKAERNTAERIDAAIAKGLDPETARQMFNAPITRDGQVMSYAGKNAEGEHTFKITEKPVPQTQDVDAVVKADAPFSRLGIKDFDTLHTAIKQTNPNITDEQARYSAIIAESVARGAAKIKGISTEQYYRENLSRLTRGGEELSQEFARDYNAKARRDGDKPDALPTDYGGYTQMSPDDGRQVIATLMSHNASTFPHELTHVWRRSLPASELAPLEVFLGVKDGNWTGDHDEGLARSYERWLREGDAPNPSLKTTFSKFKNWFRTIYQTVADKVTGRPKPKTLYAEAFPPEAIEMLKRLHADVSDITGEGADLFSPQKGGDNGGGRNRLVGELQETPKGHRVRGAGNAPGANNQARGGTAGGTSILRPGTGAIGGGRGGGSDSGNDRGTGRTPGNPFTTGRPATDSRNQPAQTQEIVPAGHKRVAVVVDNAPRTAVLTPEKATEWDAEITRYAKQKVELQRVGSKADRPGLLRAAAFQHAKAKREISGLLTAREQYLANESAGRKKRSDPDARVLPTDEPDANNPYEIEPAESPNPQSPRPPRPATVTPTGKESTVYTPTTNKPVKTRFAVVDADSLILSQTDTLADNPNYDKELQPRDRTRVASLAQIDSIARKLTPERLGDSASTAEGAPIIGSDGQVESGNGRGLALRRAYAQYAEKGQSYKAWLKENAAQFGIDPADVDKLAKPVLVRVREGDVPDRAALASEMGASPVASRSETEIAVEDGKRLRDTGLIDRVTPGETGDLNTAENRQFVRDFLATVPESERAALVQDDGRLSSQGLRRAKNAVLSAAYDDATTVSRLAESTDDNIRGVSNALLSTAPRFAKLKQGIAKGDRFDVDITGDIAEAANALSDVRRKGQSVTEYLSQGEMFGDGISPEARKLLAYMDANKRAGSRVSELLRAYGDAADGLGDPKQETLFGGDAPPTKGEVLDRVLKQITANEARANETKAGDRIETLFQRHYRGLGTRMTSPKTGERNFLGSAYEAVRASQLDTDPNVVNWRRMGKFDAIPYTDPTTGKERKYYPDFIVEEMDGSLRVEEIKPERFVGLPEIQAKAAAARAKYDEQDIKYGFVSETTLTNKRIVAARTAIKDGRVQDESGAALFQRTRKDGTPAPMSPRKRQPGNPFLAGVAEVANIPRTIMSSWDLSAPLRQGAVFTLTSPGTTIAAGSDMLKALASKKNYDAFVETIEQHPRRDLAEDSGLHLTSLGGDEGREEGFASKLATRIPGVGASERAYVAYLDRQRLDVFSRYADQIDNMNLSADQKDAALRDMANFVNVATGRGRIPGEIQGSAAKILNGVLFSPRYMSSKVHFMAIEPARLLLPESKGGYAPGARRLVATRYAQYIGVVMMTAALVKAAGGTVSTDPEQADFLKAKFGDTRYDLTSGNAQYVRLGFRLATAYTNTAKGIENPRGKSAADIWLSFGKGKLSPAASFVADASTGKDFKGNPFRLTPGTVDGKFELGAAGERIAPLPMQEFYEAYQEAGLVGVGKQSPSLLGVGVSTYKPRESKGGRASNPFAPDLPKLPELPKLPKLPGE